MRNQVDNESGIAYGFFAAVVFIVIAAMVYAVLTPIMNGFVTEHNRLINDDMLSVQTKAAFQWNLNAFFLIPVFALVGILLWSVVRALEQKRLGG